MSKRLKNKKAAPKGGGKEFTMISRPQTKEAMNDLREWLVSLVEGMPDERLLQIADAVEDAALTKDGEDPFYSEENMNRLRKSVERLENMDKADG